MNLNGLTDGLCNGFINVKNKSDICLETSRLTSYEKNNYLSVYDLGYYDGIKYAKKI